MGFGGYLNLITNSPPCCALKLIDRDDKCIIAGN